MKTYKLLTLVLIGLLIIGFQACNNTTAYDSPDQYIEEALKAVEKITIEEVKAMVEEGSEYLLIDVRDANEHHPGYIPGSINISRGTLEFNIGKKEFWDGIKLHVPKKDAQILVYCKKGKRSILAAYTLCQMGYSNVKYMEGGYKAWELAYPLLYEKNDVSHEDHGEVGGC